MKFWINEHVLTTHLDESRRNSLDDQSHHSDSKDLSFTPFSGTGVALCQDAPAMPPNHLEMDSVLDAKRDLLASAALKRLGIEHNNNKPNNYNNYVNCLITEGIPDKIIVSNNELMLGQSENLKRE
jgi:hypothetical protein